MNQDINENIKLFWKEVSNAKGGNVKSCSRINDRNRSCHKERMKREGFKRSILKICIISTLEQVVVHMCGFGGIRRGNYC